MTAKDKINLNRNQVKQIIKLALTLFAALGAALRTKDTDRPLNFVLVSRLKILLNGALVCERVRVSCSAETLWN